MSVQCAVCNRSLEKARCHEIRLTPEEIKTSKDMGHASPSPLLYYCKPCWSILTDKAQGASLIRGIMETGLRNMGVIQAEQIATKFHEGLLNKVKKDD